MTDQSHLDGRYFIDSHKYNCPFCRRGHVSYRITSVQTFSWTTEKACAVIIVECASCKKDSMHLTFLNIYHLANGKYAFNSDVDIDASIFYSVPTSLFTLDPSIPAHIRDLFTEAEGCLKSNFLTGASACARKVVYELAVEQGADGDDYESRIKSLKAKLPHVDAAYFDTLLTIQQLTSEKVHEQSYDGWASKHLRLILASLAEALREIYVIPELRRRKREEILRLKAEVESARKTTPVKGTP